MPSIGTRLAYLVGTFQTRRISTVSPALLKPHHLKYMTIAVVDQQLNDYADFRYSIQKSFICWEFASTGQEALRLARKRFIDLWMINVALPDMSGLDLCSMLKDELDSIIYIITDHYTEEMEREARIRGATMFECKPARAEWIDYISFMKGKVDRNRCREINMADI
jgi:PleD family two-component response regulator